jgi:hypothetical protein
VLVSQRLEAEAAEIIPRETLAALRGDAVQNARLCFQNFSELVRLSRLFRATGIEYRVLKGAPLAIFAYGDLTLRGAGDIDLLVDAEEVAGADNVLCAAGYLRTEPAARLTPRRMRSYLAYQKDFSYEHPEHGTAVDLHWRLFRNRTLPLNSGARRAGIAWVQAGSQEVPVLPWHRAFLYLCIHGALDGWLRIKWLADIRALLDKFPPAELDSTMQEAAEHGILPEVSAAVLLCEQKLGFNRRPVGCLDPGDPAVARIVRFANRLMATNDFCPVRELVPTTAWFINEFSLRSSFKYRVQIIGRSIFRPRVWERVSLPDWLFPLYALLGPIEWVGFRIQRKKAKAFASRNRSAKTMSKRGLVSRFFGLAPADAALLLEAALSLTFFRIALRFIAFQRLAAWMGRHSSGPGLPPGEEMRRAIRRVEWAVEAVARHAPFTFVCFPQSLAVYFMLRRRYVASKLFYGVARENQVLKAHTWIKVGERTVVGGEAESRFTVLAVFP